MENNSPNSPLFDRKVKYVQFRIQEAISLRDDEIDRMGKRLNQYKTLILEAKEKIQSLSLKIKEESEAKLGERKRRNAELNVSVARVKAAHHQSLQDLQRSQANEIEMIQEEFEDALKTLKESSSVRFTNRTAVVDNEISKVKAQIQTYRNEKAKVEKQSLVQTEAETENQFDRLNLGVIEQLQQLIQQRNNERFESLRQSKVRLAQCVDTIENMSRKHTIQVADLQNQLKELDESYEDSYRRLEDKHSFRLEGLKNHLVEAQKRSNRLLSAARRLDFENQKQLKATIRDLDNMKEKCYSVSEDIKGMDDDRQKLLNELQTDLPRLRRNLQKLDEVLADKRHENESLRRELGQCQHYIRFGVFPAGE